MNSDKQNRDAKFDQAKAEFEERKRKLMQAVEETGAEVTKTTENMKDFMVASNSPEQAAALENAKKAREQAKQNLGEFENKLTSNVKSDDDIALPSASPSDSSSDSTGDIEQSSLKEVEEKRQKDLAESNQRIVQIQTECEQNIARIDAKSKQNLAKLQDDIEISEEFESKLKPAISVGIAVGAVVGIGIALGIIAGLGLSVSGASVIPSVILAIGTVVGSLLGGTIAGRLCYSRVKRKHKNTADTMQKIGEEAIQKNMADLNMQNEDSMENVVDQQFGKFQLSFDTSAQGIVDIENPEKDSEKGKHRRSSSSSKESFRL